MHSQTGEASHLSRLLTIPTSILVLKDRHPPQTSTVVRADHASNTTSSTLRITCIGVKMKEKEKEKKVGVHVGSEENDVSFRWSLGMRFARLTQTSQVMRNTVDKN